MSHTLLARGTWSLVLVLLLTACSGLTNPFAAEAPPTATAPLPTEDAAPTSAATPTPVEMSATLDVDAFGLRVTYPQGWHTDVTSNTILLAPSADLLTAQNPSDLVVLIDATPLDVLAEQYGEPIANDVNELFSISRVGPEQAGYTVSPVERINAAGVEGAAATLQTSAPAGRLVVLRTPPSMVRIFGQASPEAWAQQRPIFDELVSRLSFFEPPTPTPVPPPVAQQPVLTTEGPQGFLLRIGSAEGDPDARFAVLRGIAVAPDGTVYAAESSRGIWVFAADGTLQGTFGERDLLDAYDVAVGPEGDIYVADFGRNDLVRFTPDGTLVERWGEAGPEASQFGLQSPQRIAAGFDGNLYALDVRSSEGGTTSSILQFTTAGEFVTRIALPEGSAPNDLSIDRFGTIYLADTVNSVILKLNNQGELLARIGDAIGLAGITAGAIDVDSRGDIYVATWGKGILKFSPEGVLLGTVGEIAAANTLPAPGQFSLPNSIATGPGGRVWVTDNTGEYSAITALGLITDAQAQATADAEATAAATPLPATILVEQWASTARASSQYDEGYAPDSATGPPDVPDCRSSADAWASLRPDTRETLELGFDERVYATGVTVYQNHQPGFVSEVTLTDETGATTSVYTGTTGLQSTCPFSLTVSFEPTLTRIVSVTLTVDQRDGATWSEVDAVQLTGLN